jgi:hypothetical protein
VVFIQELIMQDSRLQETPANQINKLDNSQPISFPMVLRWVLSKIQNPLHYGNPLLPRILLYYPGKGLNLFIQQTRHGGRYYFMRK